MSPRAVRNAASSTPVKVVMRLCVSLIGMLAVLVAGHALGAQQSTAVAPEGETSVVATVSGLAVRVKLKTHEVQIGKPSDQRPPVIESSCTYSRYPCSVVDRLDIVVNGRRIFVPRSAFGDLGDVFRTEIAAREGGAVLTLYGGDASESYIARIAFDATRVTRRTLSPATEPDQPTQETAYFVTPRQD